MLLYCHSTAERLDWSRICHLLLAYLHSSQYIGIYVIDYGAWGDWHTDVSLNIGMFLLSRTKDTLISKTPVLTYLTLIMPTLLSCWLSTDFRNCKPIQSVINNLFSSSIYKPSLILPTWQRNTMNRMPWILWTTLPNVWDLTVTFCIFKQKICQFTWVKDGTSSLTGELFHVGSAAWHMCRCDIHVTTEPSWRSRLIHL